MTYEFLKHQNIVFSGLQHYCCDVREIFCGVSVRHLIRQKAFEHRSEYFFPFEEFYHDMNFLRYAFVLVLRHSVLISYFICSLLSKYQRGEVTEYEHLHAEAHEQIAI